ncbi:A24 family peptidase [Rhodovibrio salinarum]|uniref:Prepilin type IV endopeptidase peptidase domain-containing protein n=1 Tax=Rhodovibrio salinarum TaxID=1087 RepID=A0A934QFY8_9PROT|nr:prepilin peptidase [Rhodovibrio salinarum]MBK1696278.1 hypothetical protein [Rhodovibrio salinarum]
MIDPIFLLLLVSLAALVSWCAWADVSRRRIPNTAVVAIGLLYPIALAAGCLPGPWWSGAAVASALFALGLIGFARGAVGGGDVKLAAALGLWAGSADLAGFVVITAVAGAGLSLLILATRTSPRAHWFNGPILAGPQTGGRDAMGESVPYGVALAAGGLWIIYGLTAA